jgi:Outer membrane protein beta-barrel domain
MKRLAVLVGSMFFASLPALAQTPRIEVSAGYTLFDYYQQSAPKLKMNGWTAGADVNLKRWFSVVADISGAYKTQSSTDPTVNGTKTRIYNYLFGPRLYPRKHRRISPFAEYLLGRSRVHITGPAVPPLPAVNLSGSGFTWAVGGGADVTLTHRFALRGQADFVRTHFFGGNPSQNSGRICVALLYRIKEK